MMPRCHAAAGESLTTIGLHLTLQFGLGYVSSPFTGDNVSNKKADPNTAPPNESGGERVAEPMDDGGNPLRFEDALEELEELVERMEGGELSLEQSVADFERGIRLHQFCQQALEVANQKVQILVGRSETARAGDFENFNLDDESSARASEAGDDR